MNLPTEVFGNVAVVHAPDEVGEEHAPGLLSFCTGLGQSQIVLDLDGTEFLDSAGLTAMLDAQDRLRVDDGDLKIATTNGVNRKILEITRLDQQLEVFDSVIDAVKSFRS
ncbi:MAG TPA: STAS domain-containing protein [Pirellulales bacterium]|jgi:anti-anti-sigma factor|nr:STAS domain-containing protein [Pirellulales bacterium]